MKACAAEVVVIAAEPLTRRVGGKRDHRPRREVDEIEGVGIGLGEAGFVGNPALKGGLDSRVVDERTRLGAERLSADPLSVTDRVTRNGVLRELIDQRAS